MIKALPDKCDDLLPGLAGFREHGRQEREAVHHAFPDMQFNLHTRFPGPAGKKEGIIQQYFIAADFDEDGGKARQITVYRGDVWVPGIGVSGIIAAPHLPGPEGGDIPPGIAAV